MKLKLILIAMILLFSMLFALCGCTITSDATPSGTDPADSDFVFIDKGTNGWLRFYHRDTGVMYVFYGDGNRCGVTVMLDAEGKPLIWEGE